MGNYDRKKSTPCSGCMEALKWIPVLFITGVIIWSYYAYVVELCILAIDNVWEKIVFIVFYHVVFVLFLWSYWKTIFTPFGSVPSNWRIPEAEIERLFRADNPETQKRILEQCARDLPVTNRTLNGSVRFCEKCKIIKPDRAHHCSVCGACVLKMDHHCPWVNNCVNFSNYKFFVLFLGYALLYCLYVALTSLGYFIRFWRGDLNGGMGRFHILFLFFVSIMFAISLVSLFGYHVYLVLMNRTTLEAFRAPIFRIGGPDKNGFNLGKLANFQEVFGDNWRMWFFPVYTSMGDGLQYETKSQHHSYNSMGDTQTRLDVQPTDKLINTNNYNSLHNNDATVNQPQQQSLQLQPLQSTTPQQPHPNSTTIDIESPSPADQQRLAAAMSSGTVIATTTPPNSSTTSSTITSQPQPTTTTTTLSPTASSHSANGNCTVNSLEAVGVDGQPDEKRSQQPQQVEIQIEQPSAAQQVIASVDVNA